MDLAAKLHDIPRPAWIALMVLGFIAWWPLGLAILAYLIWSGRMSCGRYGHWRGERERMRQRAEHWWRGGAPSSGNRAFDEYRAETLRRLEEEQREFREFLERLRFAKDKTEFDAFMAERRNRPASEAPPEAPPQN